MRFDDEFEVGSEHWSWPVFQVATLLQRRDGSHEIGRWPFGEAVVQVIGVAGIGIDVEDINGKRIYNICPARMRIAHGRAVAEWRHRSRVYTRAPQKAQ